MVLLPAFARRPAYSSKRGTEAGNVADHVDRTVTTGDFRRLTAKSWLALSGIERLPKFHKLCQQIVRNDDAWLEKNRARIHQIENARDVKLFLMRKGVINFLVLVDDAENANDPEVQKAARDALIEWSQTEDGIRIIAEQHDYFDWMSTNKQRIESLYTTFPRQPAVIRNTAELDCLIRWTRLGEYETVNKALERRFSEIKSWWKQNLGILSHRSLKARERITYRKAAALKAQGLSWRAVAQIVDPPGYKTNPKQCIERIRKGVGKLRATKPKEPIA